jgi:cellulose synthase/poly-beta-1,6-N-acetylglucosamine synthase-like glycosyltransferase
MLVGFFAVLSFFVLLYFILLLVLTQGLSSLKRGSNQEVPFVSVIVAARNEEAHIRTCINSLIHQTYSTDRYEIIIVNDRSEDQTASIINEYARSEKKLIPVHIHEINTTMSPKKWALHQGIIQARGEIILTTDADCTVQPGWITTMVRYFTPDVGLVAGFSPLNRLPRASLWYRLLHLDSLALAGVAAGSFGNGFPLTCSGRNLGYRKSVYQQVGGFGHIGQYISGDDDLFLHQIQKKTNWKCRYAIDHDSIVPANPPIGGRSFIQQRIRHASKGRYYGWKLTLGLSALYFMNLGFLIILFFPYGWIPFLLLLGIKSLGEWILILKMALLFDQKNVLVIFPLALLLHIPYVVVFGFLGFIGKFTWKNQSQISRMQSGP